jgi:hypothetical protein
MTREIHETKAIEVKPPPLPPLQRTVSVLEHQADSRRDGVYVDPSFTKDAVRSMHIANAFVARVDGDTYAQPL